MKRYALIFTLVMAITAGFGCAKKSADAAYGDDISPELNAAIQQITDARVYFAFNKFDIKSEYKEMLKGKADLIKRYSTIRVRIEGNCDERGTQEYNLALGERRARAAYEHLVTLGVNPGQLEAISYGKENPAVQGSGESAWSKNRRDDFRVVAH
ncbi:MAG: peptidoglycan-associated lipoprotein Pal [Desulfovibrio sp.]|jgi:peptidoglycan-associated lipoprotein|nr:peptidoglycan-associated lipoprotein Pal [Desulfovibrio sp.]